MLSDVTTPQDLDDRLRESLAALTMPRHRTDPAQPVAEGAALTGAQLLELFDAQVTSRQLDLAGRWLRSFGEGYHTISSAGHEGNAAVAAALRPTDPALLHYRSGAFYCVRAAQAAEPATGSVLLTPDNGPDGAPAPPADPAEPDDAPDPASSADPVDPAADNASTGRETDDDQAVPSAEAAPADPVVANEPGDGVPVETDATDSTAPAGDEVAGGARPAMVRRPVVSAYTEAARDVLRGMVASREEPTAGGRHKAFGRADLTVVPTTSTAASHLPRAVGMGLAVERLRRLDARGVAAHVDVAPWAPDAIVVCSFGDAAINHADATAAFNTAGWYDHTGLRIPVLFVCEDNGLGGSLRSPQGWVATALRAKPGIRYFAADGADLVATYEVAREAAAWVRRHRRPAVLHLSTVRLLGHVGADAESAYRSAEEIAADLAGDPLVATARRLVEAGLAGGAELLDRYDEIGWQIRRLAEQVLDEPKLSNPAEVIAPLAPRRPVRVAQAVADAGARAAGPDAGARLEAFGGKPPELSGPLTLAQSINAALTDALLTYPQMAVFGQDVAAKGGRYGVTSDLRDRFGPARVFDTLLDETSVLGLGLGAGLAGMLPVPEIQSLAYLHTAEAQVRGEAATMGFLSQGALRNPMVLRVAGLAYQEGFGEHVRDDNSVAVLRDVPGLVIAVPARPDDAAAMLRTCLASAAVDGSVCVFLEPVGLYHARDLYADGDGEWSAGYAEPGAWASGHVPVGRARVYGVGSAEDITIVTFGNGVRMALRAASALADEGIGSRVMDLRWLAPLPVADLIREAAATGRVLVVDETRRSGGVGEGVIAALVDAGYVGAARRVAAVDCFVPLGPAARQVLISEEAITQGARTLLAR
ncbi:transketolase domain-containing protein [Micromonospora maris AB-18-032]|uniref:Transketolase n=2 Tax=Micromonospora maris TaxID=1003110 RepID=A0A9X0LD67_9ACTN|nr:thiamine pyrophosphate-dependent enzyme [Micromonospora maris]AEB46617.1 transketolase domain-containing protein [Micromonospora maris AB-18-032]KUJ45819.1 transketolase [Micromonospora maris]